MIMNSTFYADILFSRLGLLSSHLLQSVVHCCCYHCTVCTGITGTLDPLKKKYLYSFSLHLHSSVVVINKISLLTRSRTKLAHLCNIQTVQTALRTQNCVGIFLTCDYYIHTLIHTDTHYTQHDDDHQIKVISFQLLY